MSRFSMTILCVVAGLSTTSFAKEACEMGLLPAPKGDLLAYENPGDVPAVPATGELVIEKIRPADCRHVLGFVHAPIDGRYDTWGYNGVVNEYDNSQGYADDHWQMVSYEFVKRPAIHVTLSDDDGFNYLYLRGGFMGDIYRDVDAIDGPGAGTLLQSLDKSAGPEGYDHFRTQRIAFPQSVNARRVSFFRKDMLLADAAFYRIGNAARAKSYDRTLTFVAGTAIEDVTTLGLDFIRLPASDPAEQHPSNFNRRFFREQDRAVYNLMEGSAGAAIPAAASTQVHLVTPVLPSHLPVGAVRVDLTLAGAQAGDLVTLIVNDPILGNQELLHIDVRAAEGGRVRALLDFPDLLLGKDARIWLTLAAQRDVTISPASKFSVLTVTEAQAREEHIPWRLLMLKGYYYVLSEARPFTNKQWDVPWLLASKGEEWNLQRARPQLLDLYRTIEHFREIAPDHPIAIGQYDRWLNRAREGEKLDPAAAQQIADIPGVPRWAVLLAKAADTVVAIPNWWAENRMSPDGELGGFLSDDTDFYQWWIPSMLLDPQGFAARARPKFEHVMELLNQHNLREGINVRTTDALHAYEEGQNQLSIMPMAFYGDPYYIEQLMISARSSEKWLYPTPEGGLRFRVNDFGWKTANKPPPTPVEKVSDNAALLLHPHVMLSWYNRNAHALDVLKKYCDDKGGWVQGAYNAGPSLNFAVYWHTGDVKYLGLTPDGMQGRNPWARFLPNFPQHGKEARQQAWWPKYVEMVGHNYMRGDWAWATVQSRPTLEKSLLQDMYGNPSSGSGGSVKFRYMWTEAEVYTDRVFLSVETVAQVMLGGYTVRNRIWPAYAVSYENLGGNFAALVLEQGKDRLKIAMINLGEQPRRGSLRPWQLDHGRYELSIGPDANDDGVIDAAPTTRTLEVSRMDAIDVDLPPRQLIVYDLKQVEKLDDLLARADLAIGRRDLKQESGKITVTVHNIGTAPAANVVVALVDAEGRTLAQSQPMSIEAPLDLVPRTVAVTLDANPKATAVRVDPAGQIAEITEVNNTVALP